MVGVGVTDDNKRNSPRSKAMSFKEAVSSIDQI